MEEDKRVFIGKFYGSYTYSKKNYAKPQKTCFVFPGQGVAYPGMFLDELEQFSEFKKRFDVADECTQRYGLSKPSLYIRSPSNIPKEQLHIVQNLCQVSSSLALFDIARGKKEPDFVCGHSFGEFGALAACGIISFEDILLLVYIRDLWSPRPFSIGGMMAIRANENKVREVLLDSDYFIANINSETQTVISFSNENKIKISAALGLRGIENKELKISQPYHSPLLNMVSERMRSFLQKSKIPYHLPTIPFFSSVLGLGIDRNNFSNEMIDEILCTQMITPINFKKQIETLYDQGCRRFIELGPSDVFSSIIKEILPDPIYSANLRKGDGREIKGKPSKKPQGKIIEIINRIVGKVSGYEVHQISLEDRFGEDLGIDSIKKTDIIFTVLDEAEIKPDENINISSFRKLGDLARYVERKVQEPLETSEQRKSHFERMALSWREQQRTFLEAEDRESQIMKIESHELLMEPDSAIQKVIEFLKHNEGSVSIQIVEDRANDSCGLGYPIDTQRFSEVADRFFRALLSFLDRKVLLLFISAENPTPLFEGLVSFAQCIVKEKNMLRVKFVRIDDSSKREEIIQAELSFAFDGQVLYKQGKRYVRFLEKALREHSTARLDNKVIVAIGGAKGICFSLLRQIVDSQTPIVYLIGRSALEGKVLEHVNLLSEKTKVSYVQADCTDFERLKEVLTVIAKNHDRIDLILDAAGVEFSRSFFEKDEKQSKKEFESKVVVAQNVLDLRAEFSVKKIIFFGSIIGYFGNEGQSAYASANAILNCLAGKDKNDNCVVNWPPWQGVGMTESKVIQSVLSQKMISLLEPKKAYELFSLELEGIRDNTNIFYFDGKDQEAYQRSTYPLQWEWVLGQPGNISVREFSLKMDPYLADHSINGRAYVPAAFGLVMMLYRMRLHFGFFPLLEDFKIISPIIVNSTVKTSMKLRLNDQGVGCELSAAHPCFYGRSEGKKKEMNPKVNWRNASKNISVKINNPYQKKILFHGTLFQSLIGCMADEKKTLLAANLKKDLKLVDGAFCERMVLWVDSCFQALGLLASLDNDKGSVPISVKAFNINFSDRAPEQLRVVARLTNKTDGLVLGDCQVIDERDEAVISLKEVSMRFLEK